MRRPTTGREAGVLELAGGLADRFAERAGAHDRDNTFPRENWPEMAAAGYLGLAVPDCPVFVTGCSSARGN